jgi:hypothetical protein
MKLTNETEELLEELIQWSYFNFVSSEYDFMEDIYMKKKYTLQESVRLNEIRRTYLRGFELNDFVRALNSKFSRQLIHRDKDDFQELFNLIDDYYNETTNK